MPHPPQWRLIAPQQHCLLLQRLPTELRILIYTFALVPDAEEDVKATTLARLKADLGSVARLDIAEHIARMQPLPQKRFAPPALTAVCGQIREEVLRVLPLLEKWRVARMRMQEGEAVDEWLNRPAHHAFKVRRDELVSRIQQGS